MVLDFSRCDSFLILFGTMLVFFNHYQNICSRGACDCQYWMFFFKTRKPYWFISTCLSQSNLICSAREAIASAVLRFGPNRNWDWQVVEWKTLQISSKIIAKNSGDLPRRSKIDIGLELKGLSSFSSLYMRLLMQFLMKAEKMCLICQKVFCEILLKMCNIFSIWPSLYSNFVFNMT